MVEMLMSFTFHYVSINSVLEIFKITKKYKFTFHYVSINSEFKPRMAHYLL